MVLIANWRAVLRRAWSVRLIVLAAALSGLEVALPLFDTQIPQGLFAAISALVTALALIARFIAQKGLSL